MPNNIEIKARVNDFAETTRLANELCEAPATSIFQRDTFFNSSTGRLKLRDFGNGAGELISYFREDTLEPSGSEYLICDTDNPEALRAVLEMTLGIRGEVKKARHLYVIGRTRVHLDVVENLGHFLELEVVMESGENPINGKVEARALMKSLEVNEDDLVRCAYIDLICGRV